MGLLKEMLIIFNDVGKIQFGFSDDIYIRNFLNKYKKFPFLNHGKNSLWLKGEKIPKDLKYYKVDVKNKGLVKKNRIEIEKVKLDEKNAIKRTTVYIK